MPTILDRIVDTKLQEIASARTRLPEADLERRIADVPPTRGFAAALRVPGEVRVIAEVKKASPSAGVIRPDFDPAAIARTYECHGAACISVLTDRDYFQGGLEHLAAVRAAVRCPLLRKDFVLDRYQLLEARAAGADAALLIAEILPGDRLSELHAQAVALGLDVLVELHDADQLARVLACGATLVGINNRDLRTFETRLDHTIDLMPHIPAGVTVVSESGIRTHADLGRLAAAGVQAVLVGESLMRSPDIGAALDALRGAA
ncbi:MAG TPA: indole-3-glycerol phosphate synthase TrpC [Fimbriiglobus sp.]|jgi:indole-3-glycerol phosphate synthase|nr:indole-3-glycerol phosphate synthase TrpC [Fimbriiglobus sp.]